MSDLLEFLFRLLWWPYEIWRKFNGNSRIGVSPLEDEEQHFWLKVGVLGTLILVSICVVVWFLVTGTGAE